MRLVLAFVFAGFTVSLASPARLDSPQLPQTFTNLQVLPKDVSRTALVDAMKMFTSALGVRCEHCHVGEGNDLSKFDFASDARTPKKTARLMMKMMVNINQEQLKGVGEPSATPKVTCYTCHRGAVTPLTEPPAGRGGGGAE